MKQYTFALIFFFAISQFSFGQSSIIGKDFDTVCPKNDEGWDSLLVDNKTVKYVLTQNLRNDTNTVDKKYKAIIILKSRQKKTDSVTLFHILFALSDKLNIEKFIVLRSCEAFRIYRLNEQEWRREEFEYFSENFIGKFDKSKYVKSDY